MIFLAKGQLCALPLRKPQSIQVGPFSHVVFKEPAFKKGSCKQVLLKGNMV